jgi:hypothetical protein
MAEYTDNDGNIYPRLEPEDFAAIPGSFYEYTQKHPEVLPAYEATARTAFDLVSRRPDELVVLEGAHGIGKTTQLIPELLRTGEQQGYQALGSMSVLGANMGATDVVLDAWQSVVLDKPHSGHTIETADAARKLYRIDAAREKMRLAETLRARFASAEGQNGLFVIDEGVSAAGSEASLMQFVTEEAARSGVSLAVVGPVREWDPRPAEDYRKLGRVAGKPLLRRSIPEQLVSMGSIEGLLAALGIEQDFADRFSRNDHLRRLRVLAYFAEELISQREAAGDDDFVWDTEYIESQSWLSIIPGGYSRQLARSVFGLSNEQMNQADKDLRGAS